jgi:predicted nucleotidyltransferase
MDDMFSSFSDVYIPPETLRELLEVVTDDLDETKSKNLDAFHSVMKQVRASLQDEMDLMAEEEIDMDEYMEESMRAHKENISFIDDQIGSKNSGINQL